MSDLDRLSKAEIVAKFGGIDAETLALGQVHAALKPLTKERYDYGLRKYVLDTDAVGRVLTQVGIRFGFDVVVD